MMREIKESDGKLLRRMHALALERHCQRVLDESEGLRGEPSQSAHESIDQREKAIPSLFPQRKCYTRVTP